MKTASSRPSTDQPARARDDERKAGLDAFRGVFAPSLLTILGVILYLRLGWVVGQAGLLGSLAIITLSSAITLVTALSIAAVATDRPVQGGGAYYMISRSLGVEVGGAIGVPLYLSQTLSVALYTIGFAESLVNVYPDFEVRSVALVATVAVALLALVSAGAVARVQLVILAVVGLSLISILAGGELHGAPPPPPSSSAGGRLGFWAVFAVFFPAVTGIMAGVNLSGDLREPSRDLPRGTLAAVGVGWAVYVGLAVLLAARAGSDLLIEDTLILRRMARWDTLFVAGVWGATLSSAIGSIVGAPRVLQALARDQVVPRGFRWLGRGSGENNEPRLGVLFTAALCLLAVAAGSLEAVATLLTLFFLTTYAALNLVAGVEAALGNPSYRPRFRVHGSVPLLGGLACVGVMLLLDPLATLVAAATVGALAAWLHSRSLRLYWGDLRRGLWSEVTRRGLLQLQTAADPKNWRPHLLVLSGAPTRRSNLVEIGRVITHGRGLLTVAAVVSDSEVAEDHVARMEVALRERLIRSECACFSRVVRAPDAFEGAARLVETYGLGKVVPDTILLGHRRDPADRDRYADMLVRFHELGRNVLVLWEDDDRGFGNRRRIDVWWDGLGHNGALLLMLAHLIQREENWKQARICVRRVVEAEEAAPRTRENLVSVLSRARLDADVDVIPRGERSLPETIEAASEDADLILLGLKPPDGDKADFADRYDRLSDLPARLPPTLFVMASDQLLMAEVLLDWEERVGSGANRRQTAES